MIEWILNFLREYRQTYIQRDVQYFILYSVCDADSSTNRIVWCKGIDNKTILYKLSHFAHLPFVVTQGNESSRTWTLSIYRGIKLKLNKVFNPGMVLFEG